MSAKRSPRREIYARVAVQLRSHERPIRAEMECPGSMGLYLYLLIQSRGEETNGDVCETVALTSWGAPASYRRKQIAALIKAGLIEKQGDRLHVVRYDEHNDSPEVIEENRRRARTRVARLREKKPPADIPSNGDVTRYTPATDGEHTTNSPVTGGERHRYSRSCNGDVPISISSSISLSSSAVGRSDQPDRSPCPPEPEPEPEPSPVEPRGDLFALGTAAAQEAIAVYEAAVESVTGEPCMLEAHRMTAQTICGILNKYSRAGSVTVGLEWLRATVAEWVTLYREQAQYTHGFAPKHLAAWLRGGRLPPKTSARPADAITESLPRRARQDLSGFHV